MSRVAEKEIHIPAGVAFTRDGLNLSFKGPKGTLQFSIPGDVEVAQNDNILTFATSAQARAKDQRKNNALAGTTRACVNNIVFGITEGFEAKLLLVGVGYKAQIQGKVLNLALGFSHPISYTAPDGIVIETLSQTEILITGIDKGLVGEVAAKIRDLRPPEPYKGKGIRYGKGKGIKPNGEVIILKETKKK